ncbi:MAG: glycosyltransferase, partial [Candidatus Bathyarchaeota archaeon]|nr:glycosyltransferase [Candidatus Bathyarchaeota archaeon]
MPPKLGLDGLRALTDETGMLQHTKYSTVDRREGYTTDDNARALIAALRYHQV